MANEAKRDFVKELKRLPSSVFLRQCGMGDFERLKAGAFDVSIQASRTHYSTPRELLPEADAYSAFEVAIFRDGEWVSPMRDTRFSARPWAELFGDSDISVAGYVPRETVAQILADVEAVPAMTHEKQERIQGQGGATPCSHPAWSAQADGITQRCVSCGAAHPSSEEAKEKLRAAAPELADALERVLDAQTGINMGDLGAALVAARAALRKAGRE